MVHDHLRRRNADTVVMGVNCWKNSTAVLHWISSSVFLFIVFSGSVQNVFLHLCFCIDDMFLSFNHEAMLPHFMKCHCSVFNIQIPFPFPTPCDQEVLVPFWEKSVGAPSPTWWFYTRLVKLMKWALWSHHLSHEWLWQIDGILLGKLNANVTEILTRNHTFHKSPTTVVCIRFPTATLPMNRKKSELLCGVREPNTPRSEIVLVAFLLWRNKYWLEDRGDLHKTSSKI